MAGRLVIIGAGEAALSALASLRAADAPCAVTLVGDEPHLPYRRPPLSKACLAGDVPADALALRPRDWFAGVELRLGRRAAAIDRSRREVRLDDGAALPYDALLLCTGTRARALPAALCGDRLGIHTLRSLDDAARLKRELEPGRRLLVVGGGYVGLEVAAAARMAGLAVTLVETGPRILGRVACAATADHLRALHRARGVDIREGVGLAALSGRGRVEAARLTDGTELPVDLVVAGIGAIPNQELAEAAGLAVANGIAVDAFCRTSDPAILAAGDCASFPHEGARRRLESVQNATDQGAAAAATLLGAEKPYRPLPWFWSDQYDTKLQIAGLGEGHDRIIVREGRRPQARSFWYLAGGRLLAVDAIDDPAAYMTARRLLAAGISPDPALIADGGAALGELVRERA
ncbi:NAD(P)/FAD-dependent oxidoreductase [Ancylobacter terrae]|uniref:NAD(P)/FAD-dependent oxidoreductase n=1 Tax=Ancylobacter sp. sgz301288 TaxID=3342077 RepID=UPI00385B170A